MPQHCLHRPSTIPDIARFPLYRSGEQIRRDSVNIRQLEYFIVMAETQQITEAAQQLYIAQPPLNRSLQRLENELGVVLFTRTKKRD